MAEKTTTRPSSQMWWYLLAAAVVAVYFYGLMIPLVGPDEPRYAQVAREMMARGDWVTPTLGGYNWFEKPAMLYWLEIASFKCFGVSEFAARVGPAIFGLGTSLCLWAVGRAVNARYAKLLGLMCASTLGVLIFSRAASFDIIVTFPITASLVAYYFAQREADNSRKAVPLLFAAYFFVGVSLISKGLIGIVFPFAIVCFYQILIWRVPSRRTMFSLVWGAVVAVAVASTWYLPMYIRHGERFIDEFIIQQHFERFTSNKYQHPQPLYFFFWVLPLMTIPWMPFFIAEVWKVLRSAAARLRAAASSSEPLPDFVLFSFSWMLVPLVFFSLSGSKLPGYILPSVPGAICLAWICVSAMSERRDVWRRIALAIALATLVTVAALLTFVVPRFADSDSVRSLIEAADQRGFQGSTVVSLRTVSNNAEFYAAGRLLRDSQGKQVRLSTNDDVSAVLDHDPRGVIMVLVPVKTLSDLMSDGDLRPEFIRDNGDLAIVAVRRPPR